MRLSLIVSWLLAALLAAGCNNGGAAQTNISPEMKQQLQLTAMNTNRSVFSAPLDPVELKRTHLAEAWALSELRRLDSDEFDEQTKGRPWALDLAPFLHASGSIVMTLRKEAGVVEESEPEPQNVVDMISSMVNDMQVQQQYSRVIALNRDCAVVGENTLLRRRMDPLIADPFHGQAFLLLTPTGKYLEVQRIPTLNEMQPEEALNKLEERFTTETEHVLTALSFDGEELWSRRQKAVGEGDACFAYQGGYLSFYLGKRENFNNFTYLKAFDARMREVWSTNLGILKGNYNASYANFTEISQDSQGNLFLCRSDCKLYALDQDGAQRWELDLGFGALTAPVLCDDGSTIVVGNDAVSVDPPQYEVLSDKYLEAYDAIRVQLAQVSSDGHENWKIKLKRKFCGKPAVDSSGNIYLQMQAASYAEDDRVTSTLVAISHTGEIKWSKELKSLSSMAYNDIGPVRVDGRGNVIACTNSEDLYCFSPEGMELWHLGRDELIAEAFVILPGNRLFVYGGGEAVILGERSDSAGAAASKGTGT